jgi:hypothetical protein
VTPFFIDAVNDTGWRRERQGPPSPITRERQFANRIAALVTVAFVAQSSTTPASR